MSPLSALIDVCELCGCTDDNACPGGCTWAEPGICSNHGPVEIAAALAGRDLVDEDLDDQDDDDVVDEPKLGRALARTPPIGRRIA